MKAFKSPQTNSTYTVANSGEELFVSYRPLDEETYRIRIQGSPEALETTKDFLQRPARWSDLKDGDHISIVVSNADLADAVADAIQATLRATIDLDLPMLA